MARQALYVRDDLRVIEDVLEEVGRARQLHKDYHSAHEAYGVILEEVDEFWDEVKLKQARRDPARMRSELIQVAATAVRAVSDLRL